MGVASNANSRLPLSMYCPLIAIVGFDDEKIRAEQILDSNARGRVAICILPVLEDGQHYYAQCNFKRNRQDVGTFKFVNKLDLLCQEDVLPTLDREHNVDVYLFSDAIALNRFAVQPIHRRLAKKFVLLGNNGIRRDGDDSNRSKKSSTFASLKSLFRRS